MSHEQPTDIEVAPPTSPQPSSHSPSRSVALSGREVVVKLAGMACITGLAVARVIPDDAWKWTLGSLVLGTLPGDVLRLVAQAAVDRLPFRQR